MSQTALPERYRQASNIDEGYEIRTTEGAWLPVKHVLRIYAPANIVSFTFIDGEVFTTTPGDEVMSRRPAVVLPVRDQPVEHASVSHFPG